jgi:hypothetical protein
MTTVTTGGGGINRLMSRAKDALKHRAKNAQMRDVERDFETTRSMLGSFIGEGRVRENGKGKALFISFTNVPVFAKVEALMAKSLQLRGYSPVIVTLSKGPADILSCSDLISLFFGTNSKLPASPSLNTLTVPGSLSRN